LASVIQSAQALSSTIELEELIQQLSQIILKNSGAQTCMLALPDRQDEWQIRSISTVGAAEKIATSSVCPVLANSDEYPANLIYWVKNTQSTVVFDARQPLEIPDLYLLTHQPQSVLCLPIVNQEKVLGVLYLEHRHARDIFTDTKRTVISFLCTQAAIALHNAQLYESVGQRSAAIEASLDGFAIIDRDRFIYLNQSHADMFGYTIDELLDRDWHCLYTPEQLQQFESNAFPDVSKFGRWRGEAIATRKDGSTFNEEVTLFLLDNGQLICICRDITDRNVMEVALRQSEERYYQLVSNVPGALYQFELTADGTERLNYISARCADLFEISPQAVVADISLLLEQIVPADRSSFARSIKKATKLGTYWAWEGRISTPSGKIKWIRGESRQTSAADEAIAWDGILMDVTDRKQAEIALRQSEERYHKLADNIPGVIYQFRLAPDGSCSYLYLSSGCSELLELSPAAVTADGNCLIGMIHPDDYSEFELTMVESARNLTPRLIEGRMVLNSGEIKWIKCASRPELQPDGSIVWDGIMLDVTDRKQAEFALLATNQELQQATRLKDEFLATMSHELRTPLNAILGMSEALLEQVFGTLNSRQLSSISTIEKSGEHLLSLINDILDVSKISAGKLELNIDRVSLTELCKSSLMLIKPQARAKQIQIETDLSVEPDWIFVDERRMRQVLINLLNNAVKFTPNGGKVKLQARVEAAAVCDRAEGACLCFSVSDTGIGIDRADRAKLFQPFIQIDSNLNRKYQGTGLGLVLVKQIVELHGGNVTLDSEVGKGSCFSVMLPQTCLNLESPSLAPTSSSGLTSKEIEPPPLPTIRTILLAEDNPINIDTFSCYLSAKGYEIILAQTGREAIAMTQLHTPDLILMDIQMPDLDGIAAIEYIRKQPQFDKIPIIVLTALVRGGEREQCMAAGADRYLSKPVKLSELHRTIEECLDLN
jgi:PAS domain S-box-containing protein